MTEKYSLDKASKEIQGGMAYHMNPVEDLPLHRKSLRFAVARANGLSSNSWRIKVGRRGDAYVACRSHFPGLRISLHRSGRCHVAFDSNPRNGEGHYMDQWQAPSPTLSIAEGRVFHSIVSTGFCELCFEVRSGKGVIIRKKFGTKTKSTLNLLKAPSGQ